MSSAVFSAPEFVKITGGVWRGSPCPAQELAISTDTRTDNTGKIFFALRGEKFDAHDFLEQAVNSGCSALCIEENKLSRAPENIPVLLVNNTLIAMQQCAAFHRRRFPELTVFGVTGSVGKTSVKEMLRAICSYVAGAEHTLATIGNTNNQIGVAQNLLSLTEKHRYAVIEAGTSSPGEIAPLSAMMQPTGAIINSIAPCHLENLIDLDGVAREKGCIYSALLPGGTAVFPADTAGKELLRTAAGSHPVKTFGLDSSCDVAARFISGNLNGSSFELTFPGEQKYTVSWQLTGAHNALNAAGAAALAMASGIAPEDICAALPATVLPGMRMKKTVVNGITFYNDAYNANPASMKASIALLTATALPGRLILLLGGMRELGKISTSAHSEVLNTAREQLPEAIIITIGKEFSGLSELHFDSAEDAGKYLQTILQSGDTVFAKGSRGTAVEKALPTEAR